mmetsp:Transcript_44371/g.53631  ORF Transcript_44371/g.53631 Transcript_44371/m.53631 type:complete len:208 (+) Transcript_44371:208-831(+)|eukprot:CAMPEP_0172514890 /NCGR_PEP_ID=MMETSP1066-20121228/263629_1 /TAXON_ID=671091 /ORGANISM="Coscinodiscus wailesii, Strain CCMP2513" /LENGTH=207 /DNA_ID=CAMNT_0013295749 /DNA_START=208 /DNA_END=831 /DNA_ORIENTATION=+
MTKQTQICISTLANDNDYIESQELSTTNIMNESFQTPSESECHHKKRISSDFESDSCCIDRGYSPLLHLQKSDETFPTIEHFNAKFDDETDDDDADNDHFILKVPSLSSALHPISPRLGNNAPRSPLLSYVAPRYRVETSCHCIYTPSGELSASCRYQSSPRKNEASRDELAATNQKFNFYHSSEEYIRIVIPATLDNIMREESRGI